MSNSTSKNNNSFISLFKTLMISAAIGILLMALMASVIAGIVGKIKHYEVLYPFICIFLQIIPGLLSTILTLNNYDHSLLLYAMLQAVVVSITMLAISLLVGSGIDLNRAYLFFAYTLSACFLACCIKLRRKPKYRRR